MKSAHLLRVIVTALCTSFLSLPAWAAWDGKVVVSGTDLQAVQGATLSFETGGQTVPVTVEGEDDDGNVILRIGFGGNRASAGTLTIQTPRGKQRINTPAAGPGQNIYVNTTGPGSASLQRPGTARPAATTPLSSNLFVPQHQLSGSFGMVNLSGTDPATSGVVVTTPETMLLNVPFDIDALGGTIDYQYNLGRGLPNWMDRRGRSSDLSIGLSYTHYSGDEEHSAEEPIDTAVTGFLYSDFGPPPDSTGATFGGADGLVSVAEIQATWKRIEARMQYICSGRTPRDTFALPAISFGYTDFDYELNSLDTFHPDSGIPPDLVFNHRRQEVKQEMYDIGIGGRLLRQFGANKQFDIFGDAMLRYRWSDADLGSVESTTVGATTTVRELDLEDDRSRFGLDLGAGFGWTPSQSWRAEIGVSSEWNVPTASIINPTDGDFGGEPTHLEYDEENLWGARIGLSFRF